jgi:hypothetical protein
MCNIGDKLYILGGQLDLNTANEDTGIIFVLDTGKFNMYVYKKKKKVELFAMSD